MNTRHTKNTILRRTGGFTILELLMVMLMITLLVAMVLAGFSRAKKNIDDDQRLAQMDLVRLALEQYHGQCKVYPDRLDPTANNGYPGSPVCAVSLADFLIPDFDLSLFQYQALGPVGASSGYCSAYHIAIQLEEATSNQVTLDTDSDWAGSSQIQPCSGSTSVSVSDSDGYYDIKHP